MNLSTPAITNGLAAPMTALLAAALLLPATPASADPCGMVPPLNLPTQLTGPAIERTGAQRTYVMFRDGVETIALRPGFTGKVEEFGMLIPFPSVPALRKIEDSTFAQLEGAIDPPRVHVHVYEPRRWEYEVMESGAMPSSAPMDDADGAGLALRRDEVRVLKEEAVGMYEVAVLAAGGAGALQKWMDEHEYRYPDGMDGVVGDYVKQKWVFVAIKTKVGQATGAHAAPGMRSADVSFPSGGAFDGHVQGMGFRFRTAAPVVPMRLSVFNGADPRNVVYMLTDRPVRIADIPEGLVVRQVGGAELTANVSAPLDVVWLEGREKDLGPNGKATLAAARNPEPYNGVARDLFASDLLAIATGGELSLPFEEEEKELLRVSEALGLRGPEIDRMHGVEIAALKEQALGNALDALDGLTMTVLDGVFPGEVLASKNLTFTDYKLAASANRRREDPIRPAAQELYIEKGM